MLSPYSVLPDYFCMVIYSKQKCQKPEINEGITKNLFYVLPVNNVCLCVVNSEHAKCIDPRIMHLSPE